MEQFLTGLKNKYDLILMDVRMPVMDGIQINPALLK